MWGFYERLLSRPISRFTAKIYRPRSYFFYRSGLSNEGRNSIGISLFLLFYTNAVNVGRGLLALFVEIILSSDFKGKHKLDNLDGLSFLIEFLSLMI